MKFDGIPKIHEWIAVAPSNFCVECGNARDYVGHLMHQQIFTKKEGKMIKKSKLTIRAESISKKAASEDYIKDGGYIRDWLASDIEKALIETRLETLRECAEVIALSKLEIEAMQRAIKNINPSRGEL